MCVTIDVDEDGREKLGLAGTALGGILAFFGFILMILAGFIKINIDDKLVLMRGYDPDVLPSFLLTVGIIMFVTNLVMAKVCYDSGYPETRGRFQNLLILFLLYLFVIIWFIFAASMLCFSHSSEIKDSLKDGITKMMNVYHNEPKAKLLIDRLQLDYHCCGSEKHEEWYAIGWMNMKYININNPETKKKLVEGKVVTDSVPFSCCDYLSPRPCIHHDIKDDNLHKKNTDTLSKRGCSHILMNYFDNVVLLPSGYAILMAFFVQMIMMVLLRLMQTSIGNACEQEDPVGIGIAYIIPNCPCAMCSTGDPMKYVKHAKKKIKGKKKPKDETETDDD
ncbi:peripherin-2 [Mytilus galloprovincialis]|uniref:Peripherin-2 n=1 Tax=Mytilus galloprovincialis TaxID=29158 RepID=A0A8B6HHK7_MYTGA|nr:peripherin-2 [Mytilus galloprovincialis]